MSGHPFLSSLSVARLATYKNASTTSFLYSSAAIVCVRISLMEVSSSQLETLSAAMQVPFPELTSLDLWSFGGEELLPDSFLGGSAAHLRFLRLYRIPFPGLPKLLLSATHLVTLQLLEIPHSGYIPPEAMFTVLSTLTRLQDFML
jgi:hypothetical protein